ncbi:hypothetical protein [uncultured Paracoccus sp.]|uniref:hypothetical protein n=1 Tax=uncultured Paracoccus sp. TaxID=189685 RepID=UPI00262278C4|nr:hypothetical protein [uncultured Paracoccus sp.]
MRLIFPAAAAAALLLSGCVATIPPGMTIPGPSAPVIIDPTPAPAPDVGSAQRSAAAQVVNIEMAKRLPGRDVAPYTACVMNNATMAEIADLATLSGSSAAADAVAAIVQRPGASQCISRIAVA